VSRNPGKLLRGVAKLAGVVLAAGLVGAAVGIGLAQLGGDEDSAAPDVVATNGTETTVTATTARAPYREPRFEVRSARLGTPAPDTGRARLTVRISVTNRNAYALKPRTPVLISDADEVALDAAARDAAGPLLRAVDPNETATGELRFTLPAPIAQRVGSAGSARLRIAGRTITLRPDPATAEVPG
jgi:hypothetical protein